MKKDQERLEKQLAETQTEKRKLMEPLQKVHTFYICTRNNKNALCYVLVFQQ